MAGSVSARYRIVLANPITISESDGAWFPSHARTRVEGSTKFTIAPGTYEILFKISRIEVERMVQNWVHYHPGVTATIVRTYME